MKFINYEITLANCEGLVFPILHYDYGKGQYIYQYKDHLGNVRVSFPAGASVSLVSTNKQNYCTAGPNNYMWSQYSFYDIYSHRYLGGEILK